MHLIKPFIFAALWALLLLPAGCTTTAPEPEAPSSPQSEPAVSETEPLATSGAPVFSLPALPKLAPFAPPQEIVSRYSTEEFVDTLHAATDYGRLYPYVGKITGDKIWESNSYYGLVDAQGRVVVDPVYRLAYYSTPQNDAEPAYLILAYPADEDDTEAQELLTVSGFFQRSRYMFASADGAWVSGMFYGDTANVSEDRIIIENYEKVRDIEIGKKTYRLYDLRGRLIAQGDGMLYGFWDGLGVVRHVKIDEPSGEYSEFYDYIDKNGRVAIAGPFLDAESFEGGRARVIIGETWNNKRYAVIDAQGNFIVAPSVNGWPALEDSAHGSVIFSDDGNSYGVKDREGQIIVPARYDRLYDSNEPGNTLAAGERPDGSYWIVDLITGGENKIELAGANISWANISAGNWCVANYGKTTSDGAYVAGVALLKEGVEYIFESPDFNVGCSYLPSGLFAVNYNKYWPEQNKQDYCEIFDPALGRVIKTVIGYTYSYTINDRVMLFEKSGTSLQLLLNRDFTPLFGQDVFGGDHIKEVRYVADDVYDVRTTFYSGLLKENGQWLIRVYLNYPD